MPLFGNNAGTGRAGLFPKCCPATCKLTTTWQNEWQLCTSNTAICSSKCPCTKNKYGVYGLKKQTKKKPLRNCLLIIKGKRRILVSASRQRPDLHINPAKLEAHITILFRTLTASKHHSAIFRIAAYLLLRARTGSG